jgi:hypothetical protein
MVKSALGEDGGGRRIVSPRSGRSGLRGAAEADVEGTPVGVVAVVGSSEMGEGAAWCAPKRVIVPSAEEVRDGRRQEEMPRSPRREKKSFGDALGVRSESDGGVSSSSSTVPWTLLLLLLLGCVGRAGCRGAKVDQEWADGGGL